MPASHTTPPADGLYAFVKRNCDTCALVHPLLPTLPLQVLYVQDEPDAFADCNEAVCKPKCEGKGEACANPCIVNECGSSFAACMSN